MQFDDFTASDDMENEDLFRHRGSRAATAAVEPLSKPPTVDEQPELQPFAKGAARIGMSPFVLSAAIARGDVQLSVVRVGGRRWLRTRELDRWLRAVVDSK